MSHYTDSTPGASHILENIVTVAKSQDRDRSGNYKVLTKQVLPDNTTIAFSNAYLYNFYPMKVEDLHGLFMLVKRVMANKRCCILRCEPRDKTRNVRRLFKDEDATLLDFPQNWFALDIDKWNVSSGDVKSDAGKVLLALGWQGIECFAVASSSYGIKKSINIRLFFWNDTPIDCFDLKAELDDFCDIVDHALFHPIQPIYVAPPIFVGRDDPIKERLVWLDGITPVTTLKHKPRSRTSSEEPTFSKEAAKRLLQGILTKVMEAPEGDRHLTLRNQSVFLGKLVGQGHFDFDYAVEMLAMACMRWRCKRDKDKDAKLIHWGLTYGVNIIQDQY